MKALVSGSSGLIGTALVGFLAARGWDVRRLVRARPAGSDVLWDPAGGGIDLDRVGDVDVVVHLAGENIAAGRWTRKRKARIADSRVRGTRLLASALARLPDRPKVLVSASAVGYYGDRGEEPLDETAEPGEGFLPNLVSRWEAAAAEPAEAGIRVVCLRFAMVLSAAGGALGKMLRPFKWCLGGAIGSGRQYVSWVSIDDLVRVVPHVVADESISGAVNVTAPNPVTSREFARTLGRVLRRPAVARMPAPAARLIFGQMADEVLLASIRAVPRVLAETGYSFEYPVLEPALRKILQR